MQEMTSVDIDQVNGGLAIYTAPPQPFNAVPFTWDEVMAAARTPGEYDNPNPLAWNV